MYTGKYDHAVNSAEAAARTAPRIAETLRGPLRGNEGETVPPRPPSTINSIEGRKTTPGYLRHHIELRPGNRPEKAVIMN